ncbi:helix-turn-helix domain-containing protein [uncultured Muribaculum sp.]|uniref:helix-turn-helix domain-containing protein n=1 Tax=uncultured Muribaculum sp. TaxID=1918613 RepID=UPI002593F9CA|nr:helix-turn-helix domain-containing protein [uncultured Muribaculum sp.]
METVYFDSIDTYNKLYGLPTRHPLVTVVDLKESRNIINNLKVKYGLYALFLKNGINCSLKYGRRQYDYQEGTIVSFAPGQSVEVVMKEGEISKDVIGLLFHPDLIYGTPLGEKIASFDFFDYSQMEALHLSESERAIFLDCLDKINAELDYPVDSHSASVLSANIQLLLEYLSRFYDRQFITRHKVNSEIVAQFERHLKEYYDAPVKGDGLGLPSVSEFANRANLSPKYFGELVKKETGMTTKTLIMQHMINVAKHRLAASSDDVSIIAYDLGFQYPAHFSRMFKRMTGQSPTEFRLLLEQN